MGDGDFGHQSADQPGMKRASIAVSHRHMGVQKATALGARHQQFALALLDRYRHWLASARPAERIFKKEAGAAHHIFLQRAVEFSPQLRLKLVFAGGAPAGSPAERIVGPLAAPLFLRTERTETVWRTDLAPAQTRWPISAPKSFMHVAPPVTRVFQHFAAQPAVAHPQPVAEENRTTPRTPTAWPTRRNEPFKLPAPEVERVAEQVIRTIDRRVVAQRERMGRR
jgi:hypothetical protein